MKTDIQTNICLRSAAVFLAFAFAGLAAADTLVPLKGSLQGQEIDQPQPPVGPPQELLVDGTVTGIASHLGRFTMHYNVTVSNPLAPVAPSTGSAQLTAINGDVIFATIIGQGVPAPDMPGFAQITEHFTIKGGTGRFAGAQGSFTVERLVELATGLTSGSFRGAITSPGAAQ
jgi:hypothetical protein